MPQIITSNVTVAFGDFSKFVIRSVASMNMIRLVELYASKGQVRGSRREVGSSRWTSAGGQNSEVNNAKWLI